MDRHFAVGAAAAALGIVLLMGNAGWETAAAEDLPPGISVVASNSMPPPEGNGAFEVMTFVLDIEPDTDIAKHHHPGRGQVLIVDGELTITGPDGETTYRVGESFIEEAGWVHSARSGAEGTRLVWTLFLPEGEQATIMEQ